MSTDLDPQAMRIFEQVADLPLARRAIKLDELCAGNGDLRALVDAMLAADAKAGDPFSGNGLRWSESLGAEAGTETATQAGRTIGPWRIVGELGRGGMGTVYEVQRDDGAYAQRAALKLIRSAADSPAARDRFLRERQILARLQHPNIATLLDGGISADGEPWFVMELVDGEPIDRWCDERRLGLRERVRLFLQALDAAHFAHRNLVVHRDLKPSNLLVDADGRVKLLDFGIAKQLESSDATAPGDRALTFEYASPEQLHDAPVTTTTDIWQLGIVLHRLLSGAHPFGLSRDTPLPKQLQLLEREPEPLTRAAAQAPVEQAALRGGMTPPSLARALRGSLAEIVQACLRRDPGQRYASADALASDLRAWLDDRPIAAMPLSRGERAKLWLKRNRLLAASVAAVAMALLAGTGVALWQANAARQQARIAERESRSARASLAFLTDTLAAAMPEEALSHEVSVRQLLDKARAQLEKTALEQESRQSVQRMLGHLYQSLGEPGIASDLFAAGLEGVQPRDRGEALAIAFDLDGYSDVLGSRELGRQSLAAAERAAALRRKFAPGDPLQEMLSSNQSGFAYYSLEDFAKSEAAYKRALALGQKMASPPRDIMTSVYQALAAQYNFEQKNEEALKLADEGLAFAAAHGVPAQSPLRTDLLRMKAEALIATGDPAAAEPVIREAIVAREATAGPTGKKLAALYNTLGMSLDGQGRYREAVAALDRSQGLGLASPGGPRDAAISLSNLGSTFENAGDYPRAIDAFERSRQLLDQAGVGADDPYRQRIGISHARSLGLAGRFAEAEAQLRTAQELAGKRNGVDSFEYAYATWQRVVLARRMHDPVAGLPLLQEARVRWAKLVPETHPIFIHVLQANAAFAQMQGRLAEAERDQRMALERLDSGAMPIDLADARARLADILAARGDRDQARQQLQQALPVMRESVLPQEIYRAAAETLAKRLGVD